MKRNYALFVQLYENKLKVFFVNEFVRLLFRKVDRPIDLFRHNFLNRVVLCSPPVPWSFDLSCCLRFGRITRNTKRMHQHMCDRCCFLHRNPQDRVHAKS